MTFWRVFLFVLAMAMACVFFGVEPAIKRDDWRLIYLGGALWILAGAMAIYIDRWVSRQDNPETRW